MGGADGAGWRSFTQPHRHPANSLGAPLLGQTVRCGGAAGLIRYDGCNNSFQNLPLYRSPAR